MSRRQGLARRLRLAGFRRIYPEDRDPIQYRRDTGVCYVVVQLWEDNQNRVACGVDEHESKRPTYFTTVDDMWAAIEAEEHAAGEKLSSDENMVFRAKLIEQHMRDVYGVDHCYAAAHDELRRNPNRSWLDIAKHLKEVLS